MNTRRSASVILNGLTTKSDKIRALARDGYDRSEISQILGIRYQYVRNVLIQSGIIGGLRQKTEAEREPVEVDSAPAPYEDTASIVLTEAGFKHLGDWTLDSQSATQLEATAPSTPGIYSFVVDDVVVYIGLTLSSLRARFDQYRYGHKGQKTSARINHRISQTLKVGKSVKVLIATPERMEWKNLPVNTAAGLEAGLIEMIRPTWNIKGAR